MVTFVAVALAYAAYDFVMRPENLNSLWFRVGVLLPALLALAAFCFFARKSWQQWIVVVAGTWMVTALAYLQVGQLNQPEFDAGGLGAALNMTVVLVLSAVGLVHSHSSRAVSLLGAMAIFSWLNVRDGAAGPMFWAVAVGNLAVISVFLWLGFVLRDRRVR